MLTDCVVWETLEHSASALFCKSSRISLIDVQACRSWRIYKCNLY